MNPEPAIGAPNKGRCCACWGDLQPAAPEFVPSLKGLRFNFPSYPALRLRLRAGL